MKTLASRLKEIPDCSLYFKLFSHRRLLKAHKLIAENEGACPPRRASARPSR